MRPVVRILQVSPHGEAERRVSIQAVERGLRRNHLEAVSEEDRPGLGDGAVGQRGCGTAVQRSYGMRTAAATTDVHKPFLSPSADCATFEVLMISPLPLKS